jgi:hypothetical protein
VTGSATAGRRSSRRRRRLTRAAGTGRCPARAGRKAGCNSGHRTDELEVRRAADAYWDKWLGAAALKPDLGRLAEASAPRKGKAVAKPAPDSGAAETRNSVH